MISAAVGLGLGWYGLVRFYQMVEEGERWMDV